MLLKISRMQPPMLRRKLFKDYRFMLDCSTGVHTHRYYRILYKKVKAGMLNFSFGCKTSSSHTFMGKSFNLAKSLKGILEGSRWPNTNFSRSREAGDGIILMARW
ncbi:MAG: hypothetical protein BWY74_03524 [Firmicutes bacterium ADurb.Bin419]|nr:MAG: hypothetical protein BWY74_03524 [Firmicutes bacterium ADurb.Bin419]